MGNDMRSKSRRMAVIDVTGEVLPKATAVLADAGIVAVGSMTGPRADTIRLIIRGEALPVECETGQMKQVTVAFSEVSYGSQRLIRVAAIDVLGEIAPESSHAAAPSSAGTSEDSSTPEAAPTMSIDEAARMIGIGRNQAYSAAKRGEIPTIRIGKRLLVLREPLERMLDSSTPAAGANDGG